MNNPACWVTGASSALVKKAYSREHLSTLRNSLSSSGSRTKACNSRRTWTLDSEVRREEAWPIHEAGLERRQAQNRAFADRLPLNVTLRLLEFEKPGSPISAVSRLNFNGVYPVNNSGGILCQFFLDQFGLCRPAGAG